MRTPDYRGQTLLAGRPIMAINRQGPTCPYYSQEEVTWSNPRDP
jgi:hypothetical protein